MNPRLRVLVAMVAMLVVLLAGAAPAMAKAADRNHNKIPDKWEKKYHLSMKKGQWKKDKDKDGLSALNEYRAKTSPLRKDTDRDGVRDGSEDLDSDGLTNLAEVRSRTNIRIPDTDADGVSDANEDPDEDVLENAQEWRCGTNPLVADSDDNGIGDAEEDADDDALINRDEFRCGTNPRMADSDGNGVDDADDDGDHDGLGNRSECDEGSDPRDADSDHDGVEDGAEIRGTVSSFDAATGVLVIDPGLGDGVTYTMVVDDSTLLRWAEPRAEFHDGDMGDMGDMNGADGEDANDEEFDEDFADATIDDLVEGVLVKRADVETVDGVAHATEIVLVALDDETVVPDMVAEIGAWDAESSTLSLFVLADGGAYYDFLVDGDTVFEWVDGSTAAVGDVAEGMGVAEFDTVDTADGGEAIARIVLIPLDWSAEE